MNVVDSSGWLEFLTEGPNAGFFAPTLQRVESLIVPTISIYEVYRQGLNRRGIELARHFLAAMSLGREIDLNANLARQAAHLACNHKLAMADAIILATAREYGATLWTQDADFVDIPGVKYTAKP